MTQSPAHYNIEAEQALLGAILVNNDVADACGALRAGHFHDPVHARIYETCRAWIAEGALVSPITLKAAFAEDAGLQELGGPKYLATLASAAISIVNASAYAEVIVETALRRDMAEAMRRAQAGLVDGRKPEDVAAALEGEIAALSDDTRSQPLLVSWKRALLEAVDEVSTAYQEDGPSAAPTGIAELDSVIGGMFPGDMIVLGGRPSMGKSAVASSVALNVALSGGGVIFCSLEMNSSGVALRVMSELLARDGHEIPYQNMRTGRLSESEMRAFVMRARECQDSIPILLTPPSIREVGRLRSAIRRGAKILEAQGTPLKLVVFDYLQLADGPGDRAIERVGQISRALKATATQFNVPVLVLSQLSRQVEGRDNKRPRLSDLRESGDIEQDADVVMFTYRHEYYLEREKPEARDIDAMDRWTTAMTSCAGKMEIGVAKQRMGAIGTAHVRFDARTNHFPPAGERQEELRI